MREYIGGLRLLYFLQSEHNYSADLCVESLKHKLKAGLENPPEKKSGYISSLGKYRISWLILFYHPSAWQRVI